MAKAARGDLALSLPVGFVRDPSGCVLKEPNIEVQERLELLFQSFHKLRTVAKVMRLFNRRELDLPRQNPSGDVHRARATVSAIARILKNPAYAGAFVYGRTRMREARRKGLAAMKAQQPMEEWRIVVKDKYPAYIDWPTYEKIRRIIKDNRAEYMKNKTRGAPRGGELLLHGIAWCARCGYNGEHDITRVRIVWLGGAVSELEVKMRVARQEDLTRGGAMRDRALELARAKVPDGKIASVLTTEGYCSPADEEKVLINTVRRLRRRAGITPDKPQRWRHPPELLSANELAARLEIPVNWLYVQIRKGRIQIDPQPNGMYLFDNNPELFETVRKLRSHTLENIDLRINQGYQRGHSHG